VEIFGATTNQISVGRICSGTHIPGRKVVERVVTEENGNAVIFTRHFGGDLGGGFHQG